jgi:hypothetical protein
MTDTPLSPADRAREIAHEFVGCGYEDGVYPHSSACDRLATAIEHAIAEAEAPLLKQIVELSAKVQRVEEINGNLRAAVRDQPIKWNDEYYAMKVKEAVEAERERVLTALSGEIQSVTLGPEMIAKGVTEADAISLLNQGMIIARGCVRIDGPGTFEESGVTVNVTELTTAIRSRSQS